MEEKQILANRYKIIRQIGSGGMAVVYQAYDTSLDRTVAIKLLREEYADDPNFIRRFQREAQAVARLSHSNIVSIYDFGESEGIAYLVMEYVEGYTLKDLIAKQDFLSIAQVIDYSIQLCFGMAQAHNHNIIHKDIKPHNIMVDKQHTVKVTDFGIAQAMNNLTITHNKGILGSAHYFSPEQARGDQVDFTTDIYSLGIVMYEMLVGQVPFTGDNPVTVALKHMQERPPSLVKYREDIPLELERIIFKALEKKPDYRFKSMQEMANALIALQLRLEETGYSQREMLFLMTENRDVESLEDKTRKQFGKDLFQQNDFDHDNTRIMNYTSTRNQERKANKKILMFFLFGSILLFLATMWFVSNLLSHEDVQVPDLCDKTLLEAEKMLSDLSLKITVDEEIYDNEIEEDHIVSQLPKAGSKVKEGREIAVVVSLGKSEVAVPDLQGKTEQEARIVLENKGLTLGAVTLVTDINQPFEVVVYQAVEAGEKVEAGTAIDVMINNAEIQPENVNTTVPYLTGKTLEEALRALEKASLVSGTVSQASSTEYYNNCVINQKMTAGSQVQEGTAIDFTVSTGPGPQKSAQFDLIVPEDGTVVVTLVDATGGSVLCQKICEAGERLNQSFLYYGSGTVTITCDGKEIWSKIYES